MAYTADTNHSDSLTEFLSQINLFSEIPHNVLAKISSQFKVVNIGGGETLIYQYDSGECMYLVVNGRLRIFREDKDSKVTELGEVGRGGFVGEIALLLNEPRVASVIAVRDSTLLKLSRNAFNELLQEFPLIMLSIIRNCVRNLISDGVDKHVEMSRNIVMIPATKSPMAKDFIVKFCNELNKFSPTLHLTSKKIDELLGEGTSSVPFEGERNPEILEKIYRFEKEYKYIVYETDSQTSAWTLRCLRQADRIIYLTTLKDGLTSNDIAKKCFKKTQFSLAKLDLVMLYETHKVNPKKTIDLLSALNPATYHHLIADSTPDIQKLVRFISGNSFGLVLSGGGARGLGHLGVIKALEENEISVDFIAGTSMGAYIAAICSKGYTYSAFSEMVSDLYKNYMRHRDYTLPFTSLLKGGYVYKMFIETFGEDTKIEDLWRNFFCVSTNISNGQLFIHETGNLRDAVSASVAIPGIYPPFITEAGQVLVDGGLLNNLPVDIMRSKINGGKVIAVNIMSDGSKSKYPPSDKCHSGWNLGFNYFVNGKKMVYPSILELLMSGMTITSSAHRTEMTKIADFTISLDMRNHSPLAFHSYRELIDQGYAQAVEQLHNYFNSGSK